MDIEPRLPADWRDGRFLGRVLTSEGPTPILLDHGTVRDLSSFAPTISSIPLDIDRAPLIGSLDVFAEREWKLLSPLDLHCVKAAGVTFAVSAIERVIEEKSRGDASAAARFRDAIEARVGSGIRSVAPGSEAAATLKAMLIEEGIWSQYLEVAIGPDAEIFTKAPVLSTVGTDAPIGIRSDSSWNNPEPEIVLIADARGRAIGAALGNDVNLRDFEGRSALLLGKAKDNRASCSVGPFIRLFDSGFTIDDVRRADVDLLIEGTDGFRLEGRSSMAEISRDPLDLIGQAMSEHDYPDGFALFLGTLFAPIQDRDEAGRGFTHKEGDRVTISSTRLGALVNTVTTSKAAPRWTFGVADLMYNLASRGLLAAAHRKEPA